MADSLPELIQNGNSVTRWHTFACLHLQSLASHSWGVAMIISRTFDGHPSDELLLLKCALEHDLAEKHIGDMPKPGRSVEHQALEEHVAGVIRIRHESTLPDNLLPWLKWADLIEAGLYAQRECQLGNQHFAEIMLKVGDHIKDTRGEIPPPLFKFAQETGLVL